MKADYIHKDSLTLGELDGVKVMLSPEAYAEVKKQKIIEENKILKEQQQELERYKNIVDELEEELERETNIKEEDAGLEHNTYLDINQTLKKVLNRLKELKGE